MYSPESISNNTSNLLFSRNPSSTFKHVTEPDFLKSKEDMDASAADLYYQQQQNTGVGLMRYRSAPSSFFAALLDGANNDNNANNESPADSSESDTIFSALLNVKEEEVNKAVGCNGAQQNGFSFEAPAPPRVTADNGSSYAVGGGSLVRQSSSPAGFFSGFDLMRDVGNFRSSNGTNEKEVSSSAGGLNNSIAFSSGPSSNRRFMPSIAENGNENVVGGDSPRESRFENSNGDYIPSFPSESWSEAHFSSLKRNSDEDLKMFTNFNGMENQSGESKSYAPAGLTHHLSLPKTSAEMAAIEKYLQFQQDAVPCKIRAKRGCATHPRSIAERMRRTRISERMKKLQELFPNMDKQTNTADMLDMAVEYIKDLQKQVQTLSDTRAKCTCSNTKS